MKLLDKAQFDIKRDELWCTGDLINRGANNLEVLRFCRSLESRFTCVLGNHDLHFLAVALGYREIRGSDTFHDILAAEELNDLITWLRSLPLFHYDKKRDIALVHAGIPHLWSIKKTRQRAKEVAFVIRDDNTYQDFFANMYGNKPDRWHKSLESSDRWRVITNYLTRMRFCDVKGKLELTSKTAANSSHTQFAPWFNFPAKRKDRTTVLFGHWAALEGKTDLHNVIGLDTGCVWGGKMTLVNVDDISQRISVRSIEK